MIFSASLKSHLTTSSVTANPPPGSLSTSMRFRARFRSPVSPRALSLARARSPESPHLFAPSPAPRAAVTRYESGVREVRGLIRRALGRVVLRGAMPLAELACDGLRAVRPSLGHHGQPPVVCDLLGAAPVQSDIAVAVRPRMSRTSEGRFRVQPVFLSPPRDGPPEVVADPLLAVPPEVERVLCTLRMRVRERQSRRAKVGEGWTGTCSRPCVT